ncbi:UDP-N-acetylglucosamine 1-carboxyvinyltransferase [Candidatus Parcubacteria bacterium]|nr:MAG: UDP-N-acetylglucosamine 1-carboxyvinyltransferase [Candidatus Parcubacteria bacterium]
MAKFIVTGGKKLKGEIAASGSKNAALPIIAASLLSSQRSIIRNVPLIKDVLTLVELIKSLGAKVIFESHNLYIEPGSINSHTPNPQLAGKLRGSILLLGPMLAHFGKIHIPYPGGDLIGPRPIDTHLKALKQLGAEVEEGDILKLEAKRLKGTRIILSEASVTATENLLMAATLAQGETIIRLAAMEPHVVELAKILKDMGAKIEGIGTPTLTIKGVKELHGFIHTLEPDPIEVGSFAILAATTKSPITIKGVNPENLDAVLIKLSEIGVNWKLNDNNLLIEPPPKPYQAAKIQTGLYPALPTDLQSPFGVLATQAQGTSLIHDWMYEGRLAYINELRKMGANAFILDPHRAIIHGPTPLYGKEIHSLDIRSGITMIIASLAASGQSIINDAEIIDRGYENIEARLQNLGAQIERIN